MVLILLISEGGKAELTLEPLSGIEHMEPLDWESSTLTTAPMTKRFNVLLRVFRNTPTRDHHFLI